MSQGAPEMKRCAFCGAPEQIIWVHGHGQCAHCKVNAHPCCDGDERIGGEPDQEISQREDLPQDISN